ncbi:SDR family NAD(P)-dependent oxidoreductase [Salinicoccus hispanicus]|uniref:SDR family NAD(P)-dependent oxidoreductase n=2 Tax=Salinicoccus hispanicus TaxID=157225 RepID=A0A6N8U200_9STAP|nr:SDR family NAD(P)-dependent oxidoreductase [Salinicoccus hispanicus]
MVNYKGKTALVTGASGGIGKAYAKELASRGSHVILVARSDGKLNALADELSLKHKVDTYIIPLDLSEAGSVDELAERIKKLGLNVDILINNAGFGTHGRFETISIDREQEMIRLNISTLVGLAHQFLPYMQQQRDGVIVNLASVASFQPLAYMATYAATKAFVLSFSEALYAENRHLGVRILALCPGTTKTSFFDVMGTTDMPGGIKGTPESVVKSGFKGIAKNKSYIVDGANNYWVAQASRFMTRKAMAVVAERVTRPSKFK